MADREIIREGRSGNSVAMILLAIAIIIAAAVGFMYVNNENKKNDAVTGAAKAVGDAAKDVGDAVKPSN